ncbi:MAG: low-complexity protein [Robiginitomaculum sp.]|nr:MAG: low-complexity protein [Robiginitomaculum sp.]
MKNLYKIAPLGILTLLLTATSASAVDPAALTRLAADNACEHCDLSGADLSNKMLKGAGLNGANLTNANLNGINLEGAHLVGADLTGAKMVGAKLSNANLSNAKLVSVDLTDADLSSADVNGTILIKSDVTGASFLEVVLGNFGQYASNTECRTTRPNGSLSNQNCRPNE